MDVALAGLRVLREVAEKGTLTAAADSLGYTQSAVSRQIAALERAVGHRLFDRRRTGMELTAAGRTVLRHASVALDALADAESELSGGVRRRVTLRLGVTPVAAASLLPAALTAVRSRDQILHVTTREGTSSSLLRALRAGTIDVALLTSRPPHRAPDSDSPPLQVTPLVDTHLRLAVAASGPFGGRSEIEVGELTGAAWIASSAAFDEPVLGVWPGMPGRPRVAHISRDWLVKLRLVAAGAGITTVPASMAGLLPDGVQLSRIAGLPDEVRRVSWVSRAGPADDTATTLLDALRQQAERLP